MLFEYNIKLGWDTKIIEATSIVNEENDSE